MPRPRPAAAPSYPGPSFKVFNVLMLHDCMTKELGLSTRFFYIPYAGALHTCLSRTNPPPRAAVESGAVGRLMAFDVSAGRVILARSALAAYS